MEIQISTEYIKLQQLLKLAGFLGQGSDIKYFLGENLVQVNGEIATERGKKIRPGDKVLLKGQEEITVVFEEKANS